MPWALRVFSLRVLAAEQNLQLSVTAAHLMLGNTREHQAGGVEGGCWLNSSDHNTAFPLSVSLQVGFFPSECVELINDKVPQSVTNSVPKPGV